MRTPKILKRDAQEIVRRLTDRNPQFERAVKDGKISLANFAEIVLVQGWAFNNGK